MKASYALRLISIIVLISFCAPIMAAADSSDDAVLNSISTSSLTDEDASAVRKSLNLPAEKNGSAVSWSSSNPNVITSSGRVIRPRFDENDATVTMTATVGTSTKNFTFTVLKDETPQDPMYSSDEDFFGVWNGTSFNSTPQLDYSVAGLSRVLDAVKNNDYTLAKNELLNYVKTRTVPSPVALGTRMEGWADQSIDGVFSLGEDGAYYRGLVDIESDDYELVSADLYNPSSLPKSEKTLELIARYNESSFGYIIGTGSNDTAKIPELELTVGGVSKSFKAVESATIRAGSYSKNHISANDVLTAKTYGDFLGDETYRILLKFDLSSINASESISSAKLKLYAKKTSAFSDSKELWIVDNYTSTWDEDSVYWDKLNFVLHNYNGLIGGNDWEAAKSSDVEYQYQAPRFMHARTVMTEYKKTGDEKYAYGLLGQIMDFIKDKGNDTLYPRSLDAAIRLHQLVPLLNSMKDSRYLTSEFVTAFYKHLYSQFKYFPTRADATGNWREYEQLAVLYATSAYPELSNSLSAKDACIESWMNALNKSFLPDGSYSEDSGGYHRSSYSMYVDFKKAVIDSGGTVPKEFDDTLHKAAYYMLLAAGPDGETLQYGDEAVGKISENRYEIISDWYNDDNLRFIDSRGAEGVEPDWTSYSFSDGRYTVLRSDWERDADYLFTSVRGIYNANGHGHGDDNSIIYIANGKRLLVDSGKFSYTATDPARQYGLSTQGHNTIVVNNTSQRITDGESDETTLGNINSFVTNKNFDFLSQTSKAYSDYSHTRNIFFIKDGLFIVSDLITPSDINSENEYEQYWHMPNDAGIAADNTAKTLSSHYADGKNIILSSADDVSVTLKDGYYETTGDTVIANKAGVFAKTAKGKASFDTFVYASEYNDAALTAERLSTGKNETEATAMKITLTENAKQSYYYYMYNHAYTDGAVTSFGDFSSDAKAVLICLDASGEISYISLVDGSYIKKNDADILKISKSADDFFLKSTAKNIDITTSDASVASDDVSMAVNKEIDNVVFNGKTKGFQITDGILSVLDYDFGPIVSAMLEGYTKEYKSKIYLLDNLNFDLKSDADGYALSYSPSDTDAVTADGRLIRDNADRAVTITLTASKDGKIFTEAYDYIVPGKYNKLGMEAMPLSDLNNSIVYESFEFDELPSSVTTAGTMTAAPAAGYMEIKNTSYAEVENTAKFSHAKVENGTYLFETVFETSNTLMRFDLVNSWNGNKGRTFYMINNKFMKSADIAGVNTYESGEKIHLSVKVDFTSGQCEVFANGNKELSFKFDNKYDSSSGYNEVSGFSWKHMNGTYIGTSNWATGTTRIYSYKVSKVIDESGFLSVMRTEPQVSSDKKTAAVPIVSMDDTTGGVFVYAVYTSDGRELLGVDIVDLWLDKFSHREYKAQISENIPSNAVYKCFYFNNMSDIDPLYVGVISN